MFQVCLPFQGTARLRTAWLKPHSERICFATLPRYIEEYPELAIVLRQHRSVSRHKKAGTKSKPVLESLRLTYAPAVTFSDPFLTATSNYPNHQTPNRREPPAMDIILRSPEASANYNSAKADAILALGRMTYAMRKMGAEHTNFHKHFADVQKRLQDMKNAYGGKELDVEVIRSTALDTYLSEGNLPKVTALGHFEVEKALMEFQM